MKIYGDVMVSVKVSGLVSPIPILPDTTWYRPIPDTGIIHSLPTDSDKLDNQYAMVRQRVRQNPS